VNVTTVKAAHITELRTAVNAVRSLAGLAAAQWTNQTLTATVTVISADDVRDLRLKLDEALTALGIQTSTYDDQTLAGAPNGTVIKKIHITQLRQRSTSGTGGAGGSSSAQFGVQWLVTDQLGTPRMVFDQTGSLANIKRHDYLPFGEDLVAGSRPTTPGYGASDGVRQKFTGYEHDGETGLEFAQARYYASMQGRFTGVDPMSGQVSDPQSWNRYAYVGNNPVNLTDPTGMNYFIGGGAVDQDIAEFRPKELEPRYKNYVLGQDPKQPPPATRPGDDYPASPNGSPMGKIADVTVFSGQDPVATTTLDFPGTPRDAPGDSIVERFVSSPVQTALEVADWASKGVRRFGYALLPDYGYVSGGIPLVASGSLQYSKDGHLYFSFAGPTAGAKNFTLGGQVGIAYFASTDMKAAERDRAIQGPGINATTPFTPLGAYFPLSGGPPAVTVGWPFSAGANGSRTYRIF
jgi:RHS repeat-associated protein